MLLRFDVTSYAASSVALRRILSRASRGQSEQLCAYSRLRGCHRYVETGIATPAPPAILRLGVGRLELELQRRPVRRRPHRAQAGGMAIDENSPFVSRRSNISRTIGAKFSKSRE